MCAVINDDEIVINDDEIVIEDDEIVVNDDERFELSGDQTVLIGWARTPRRTSDSSTSNQVSSL
jgi:hypothetical protein